MFGSFTLYYTSPKGREGTISVFNDGSYDSIDDFVGEFLEDHVGYSIDQVKEEVE